MSTEQAGVTKPSKVAITKLLAEAEVARRRSIRPWLLAFLLPLLAGAALIAFSSREVYVRLQKVKQLDQQIAVNEGKIKEQNEKLEALGQQLQGTTTIANAALAKLPQAEAKEVLAATAASDPTAAATTPHVFIQIHDEEQRKKAADVAQALKNSGFIVPGIERRPEKVESDQVKFFRQEDKGFADKVAGALTGQGVTGVRTVFVGGYKVPPGQIEIWLAPALPPTISDGAPAVTTATPTQPAVFAVVRGDFKTLAEAIKFANDLSAKKPPYPVEIYRHVDGSRYYVTLGGHLTNAEARKRTDYANKTGLGKGAYPSDHATGDNLYH